MQTARRNTSGNPGRRRQRGDRTATATPATDKSASDRQPRRNSGSGEPSQQGEVAARPSQPSGNAAATAAVPRDTTTTSTVTYHTIARCRTAPLSGSARARAQGTKKRGDQGRGASRVAGLQIYEYTQTWYPSHYPAWRLVPVRSDGSNITISGSDRTRRSTEYDTPRVRVASPEPLPAPEHTPTPQALPTPELCATPEPLPTPEPLTPIPDEDGQVSSPDVNTRSTGERPRLVTGLGSHHQRSHIPDEDSSRRTAEISPDNVEISLDKVKSRRGTVVFSRGSVESRKDKVESSQDTVETRKDRENSSQDTAESSRDSVNSSQDTVPVEPCRDSVKSSQVSVKSRKNPAVCRKDTVDCRRGTKEYDLDIVESRSNRLKTSQDTVESSLESETQQTKQSNATEHHDSDLLGLVPLLRSRNRVIYA
eukprot:scpid71932/ scgid3807/ 